MPVKTTRVSWPVPKSKTGRRFDLVYSWEPPPRDLIDPRTGEPQRWERGHVRSHLAVALDTLKRLPMPARGLPGGARAHWPATINDAVEAYGYDQAVVHKGASPMEIQAMEWAISWMWWLPLAKDPVIVTGFASGVSSRRIAKLVGRNHQHCWRRDRFCLQLIAERLNGRGK